METNIATSSNSLCDSGIEPVRILAMPMVVFMLYFCFCWSTPHIYIRKNTNTLTIWSAMPYWCV